MESQLVLKKPSVGMSPLPGPRRFSLWKSFTVAVSLCLPFAAVLRAADDAHFNKKGNIVIADQYNNRVIEIDPATHKIVWQFGDGSSVPGPHSIVGTNDAERFGSLTLISGTGIPALPAFTTPPTQSAIPVPLSGCPVAAQQNGAGCPDNRVILVNQDGEIVWQYGQDAVAGSGPNQLNVPVAATVTPDGHFLITDQSNERVIEVDREKNIVWQYGVTGVSGITGVELNNPNSAELLANGDVLIADENNNRAIEVTHDLANPNTLNIVATFTAGGTASGVAFASRLPNGDTLLTDSNNSRVVEVDKHDGLVWQFVTSALPGSVASPFLPLPTRAIQLSNGNVLISDQYNDQVIEVTPSLPMGGAIVFTQGQIGFAGDLFNRLNGPYDAKVIGDFTGLTPPPQHFELGD